MLSERNLGDTASPYHSIKRQQEVHKAVMEAARPPPCLPLSDGLQTTREGGSGRGEVAGHLRDGLITAIDSEERWSGGSGAARVN